MFVVRSVRLSHSAVVCVCAVMLMGSRSFAALDVFVDFGKSWVTSLDTVTTAAGVTAFTSGEITTIESGILSRLGTMYSDYSVTFSGSTPGGSYSTVDFGVTSSTAGVLGAANLDFLNLTVTQTASVFTNNFGFILDEFSGGTSRSTQLDQLTAALAGTGGHELGHSLGLRHHHAYGDPGITPANYAATGDIQDGHIMGTGSTGLGEVGRETDRTFSQWSDLILEGAGGGISGFTGTPVAATPLVATASDWGGGDVGDTFGTATALSLSAMAISGLDAANTFGVIGSGADVDYYSFTVTDQSRLYADIYSHQRWTDNFDSGLLLYDTDGTSVLAANDDTLYGGNTFGVGSYGTYDSSFLNVLLPGAGTYYLAVNQVANLDGADGGDYNLIFGTEVVPEPGCFGLLLAGIAMLLPRHRRRRRRCAVAAC